MPSLIKRTLTAVTALIVLYAAYALAQIHGIFILGIGLAFVGAFEFYNMTLKKLEAPLIMQSWYYLTFALILFSILYLESSPFIFYALFLVLFWSGALWGFKDQRKNEEILSFIKSGTLSLIYCTALPAICLKILMLNQGLHWFSVLLMIVFAGDISAYFGGILFGKKPLMSNVSPKKTVAGSYFGFLGSMTAGVIGGIFLLESLPMLLLAAMSFGAALLAQSGDLFISLIKRVGNIKDSGKLLPGHGGVLDRLDGLYFAAPIILVVANWSQNL